MRYIVKINLFIWLLGGLALLNVKLSAQVQGDAFFAGQSNHNGISVIFTNTSTSGASDTVLTQNDGSYSINLSPGVYDVRMEASGYQTVFYNQNQAVLLSGTDVLLPVTLLPGPIKYISGTVSGTLFGDTIYIANGDLLVDNNTSLVIEEGTELRFEPDYSFTIDGQLTALGTQAEPILFTLQSIGPGFEQWGGIKFITLDATSELQYCTLEYAKTLLDVTTPVFFIPLSPTPRLIVENSIFRHSEDAALVLYSHQPILIANNEIYDFGTLGISFAARNQTSPNHYTFVCNSIHNGDNYGIYTFSTDPDALISGNTVYDIPNGIGIRVSRLNGGEVVVQNNIIYNVGQGVGESAVNSPIPAIIRNNVIFNSGLGISMSGDGGAIVKMNAVFNNDIGINQFNSDFGTPLELSYNLISQNNQNYSPEVDIPFAGVPITSNANGDTADAYFNIDFAPQLDTTSFFPMANSPLINAGDPSFLDLDGTTRDIGLYYDASACWTPPVVTLTNMLPGDANNDQFANVWDLLPIGLAYGQTGPTRPNASISWMPQPAPDWGISLPSGIDLKHVDSDGDGMIQADDTLAIVQNYNQTQSGTMQTTGGGIPLYMNMPTVMNPGDTLEIPVMFGTIDTMVNNFYGLAFSMSYDTSQVKPNSVSVAFDSTWVGNTNQDLLTLFHDDFNDSVLEVAMVRTDGVQVSGFGQIASVIVVLDDDIAKKEIDFNLTWRAVDAIHSNQVGMMVSPQHAIGNIIANDTTTTDTTNTDTTTTTTSNEDLIDQRGISYFPNPAHEHLNILRKAIGKPCELRLMDLAGKLHLSREMNASQSEISLPVRNLPDGIYLLQLLEPGERTINMKVLIE